MLVESSAEPVRSAYTLVATLAVHYMDVERREPEGALREMVLADIGAGLVAKTDEVVERAKGAPGTA